MNLNLIILIIYLTIYLKFIIGITFIPILLISYFFTEYLFIIDIFKNIVYNSVSFISHMLVFKNIYVNSNKFIQDITNDTNNSNIIMSNHLIDIEFIIYTIIFSNCSLYNKNIGITKKNVGYQIDILGFLGIFTGDIFLYRKLEQDIYKLKKQINFNNLLIFPEGTCFTNERKIISDIYCNKKKLIKFNYHLYPRITGIKIIISNNNNIKWFYDFTIIYDKIRPIDYGKHYNTISYILNIYLLPKKVYICINKYKINYNNIDKQIEKIFYKKDKIIKNFDSDNNKFTAIEYNYYKNFWCFILINLLTILPIYLFIKYNFFKYLFLFELFLYYIYFFLYV